MARTARRDRVRGRSTPTNAMLLVTTLVAVGLMSVSPGAHAIAPKATARQLAGSIPSPFVETKAVAKAGDSLFVIDAHGIDRIHLATLSFEVFAGSRATAGAVDGTRQAARFNDPQGLTTDGTNLFVADTGNDTIRKIVIATGVVTTVAGVAGQSGALDGVGTAARFFRPFGITTNGASLWITDRGTYTVRKLVLSTASVTTVAGSPLQPGTADGTGAAARFSSLAGIVREGPDLWIADADRVRRLVPSTGAVSTTATLTCTTFGEAQLHGITFAGGRIYVVLGCSDDESGYTELRELNPATGASTRFSSANFPYGVATDGTNLYVTAVSSLRTVYQVVLATGAVSKFYDSGFVDGTGAAARFGTPGAIATDGPNLYVSAPGHDAVRKVSIATGETTTFAAGLPSDGIAIHGGFLYVSGINVIRKVEVATGTVTPFATVGSGLSGITGIATDGTNLYTTHTNCALYRVSLTNSAVTLLAGSPGACGYVDGTGAASRFGGAGCGVCGPNDITTDGTHLWVADSSNHVVRKVVIATAAVTTLSTPATYFSKPYSISFAAGSLYVDDEYSITRVVIATGAGSTLARTDGPTPLTYTPSVATSTQAPHAHALLATPDGRRLLVAHDTGIAVIEDPAPALAIGNSSVVEGDGGTGLAVFTVRLSRPAPGAVNVSFTTVNGTATAASGDYVAQSGTVTIPAGDTEGRVKVTVNGDGANEGNEAFKVNLAAPTGGAVLSRASGNGTVLNDDPPGGTDVSVGDPGLVEGDEGAALLVFPVRLSSAQPSSVNVGFTTANGSATAGSDYEARSGTLSFPAGVTSATVWVKVFGDYAVETTETVSLWLTSTSGPTIARVGTGKVINDD